MILARNVLAFPIMTDSPNRTHSASNGISQLCCCNKYVRQSIYKEKRFIVAHSFGGSSS